ncbi:response regulator [Herbivorax sp. ANBcel31]|uniref:response regulator n=1 Tax=Herbivorax sp. ANBcel31 TaxID=3069754 RepID=UPI0027B53BF8|nr:response regulator [Herbivorax sp. ANBcel31]MDQ2084916.1 response regulator [Herbivorax sp. ANBcel31]
MRILIAEDDFASRRFLKRMLMSYGRCHTSVNGIEALEEFKEAFEEGEPYDVVFIDIMMPEMDGQELLKKIREYEKEAGLKGLDAVKTVMVTALRDIENIKTAFLEQCEAYLPKPVERKKMIEVLDDLGLIKNNSFKE